MMKKLFKAVLLAGFLSVLSAGSSFAEEQVDTPIGPAYDINIQKEAEVKKEAEEEAKVSLIGPGTDTVEINGITYKKTDYQGVHKLSAYVPSVQYGRMTASGKTAQANHTVSYSSVLPMGTQILIQGSEGPYCHDFDGVYTVEDRGDYHIETEGWIDIFFENERDCANVTGSGWNYADVWVVTPLN